MILPKTLKILEYDKILAEVSKYAVLEKTKQLILNTMPASNFLDADFLLKKTEEAYKLLFTFNVGGVYYFDDVSEELTRVNKGGTLINAEFLRVLSNLKSAKLLKNSISAVSEPSIKILDELASNLVLCTDLEEEIARVIISEDEINDHATPKLYSIRRSIRSLNAKIREKLNSYMRGNPEKYMQDSVVTMRHDRYVIPVKSEFRSQVKGFIHDQSASGATVFIEPDVIIELNNELKRAMLDEANEINKILAELSNRVALVSEDIKNNAEIIGEIDLSFAKAFYSFGNKNTKPNLVDNGVIDVKKGKHPLINKEKVVPIDVCIGKDFNILLLSGPNTGGKTVTMKLVGLISLMAMSGLYIPAQEDSTVSVFNGVFCDIGDEQSIEQNLSTFSSHILNIKSILDSIDEKSLVLIDEIGAGTDPDEGSSIALATIEKFLKTNCFGIFTTHYTRLKEFAINNDKIENGSMEFDPVSFKPLYKLNVGIPGNSNAIEIAKSLGFDNEIVNKAISYLSTEKIEFVNIIKKAEISIRENEELIKKQTEINNKKQEELNKISLEREKIEKEREKINQNAKQEVKRIVEDKLEEAEEIIEELKSILNRVGLESKELFKAGELRNRLRNSKSLAYDVNQPLELKPIEKKNIKTGNKVYVKKVNSYGVLGKIKQEKEEAEVFIGNVKFLVKFNEIFTSIEDDKPLKQPKKTENDVKIYKSNLTYLPKSEINVLGKTTLEAISDIEQFISEAILNNLEEIKIIHGVGTGALLKCIRGYLSKCKNVLEFRRGKYGEGENGVTIIKLN
ncbi:MAG: endonuclease MutS2 [Clostridia bacterium]|nr:endonuclease MutS2 [Clostridia bacterium]